MILRELVNYYDALAAVPDLTPALTRPGWAEEKIRLCVELSADGKPTGLTDLGDRTKPMPVPKADGKRTSGVRAISPFWDKTDYALGAGKNRDGKTELFPERWRAFSGLARTVVPNDGGDPDLRAFRAFLDSWKPENAAALNDWEQLKGGKAVFRVNRGGRLHDIPAARDAWARHLAAREGESEPDGECLVSGKPAKIALVHNPIMGAGGQSSGAAIVSFNQPAFASHGWTQNRNAPVSAEAAFKYTAVLNRMLRRENRQRVHFSGTGMTVVFWTENADGAETEIVNLLSPLPKGEDETTLREKLEALKRGIKTAPTGDEVRFFALGLSPNNARLSVRLWMDSTLDAIRGNVLRHYEDAKIGADDRDPPTPFALLRALSPSVQAERKKLSVPEKMVGDFFRAILSGGEYPRTIPPVLLQRARTDGKAEGRDFRDRDRAALLKAVLRRRPDFPKHRPETQAMLNPESTDPAYNLGRLFAVLEKAQGDALGEVSATVRDRYIGGALARPASVFPVLMRGAQHHLRHRAAKRHDKLIEEIHNRVREWPRTLQTEEQGRFFLGYYHQRRDLWTRKEKPQTQPTHPAQPE